MIDEIKEGDIVRFKSGGPKMTVTSIGQRLGVMTAWCTWSDGGKNQREAFPLESLRRVDSILTEIKELFRFRWLD